MVVQVCEDTKNHWSIYFKWVHIWYMNYISIQLLYLKKITAWGLKYLKLATMFHFTLGLQLDYLYDLLLKLEHWAWKRSYWQLLWGNRRMPDICHPVCNRPRLPRARCPWWEYGKEDVWNKQILPSTNGHYLEFSGGNLALHIKCLQVLYTFSSSIPMLPLEIDSNEKNHACGYYEEGWLNQVW